MHGPSGGRWSLLILAWTLDTSVSLYLSEHHAWMGTLDEGQIRELDWELECLGRFARRVLQTTRSARSIASESSSPSEENGIISTAADSD